MVEFIESNRGKSLLVLNNYKFCIGSVNKFIMVQLVRITKNYKAKVYTENNAVIQNSYENLIHNHEPYIRTDIFKQIVNITCKRKAVENPSKNPKKIILQEILEKI